MKTKLRLLRWLMMLILSVSVLGVWAQNQNSTQTVCIGNQSYNVDPVPGATFVWSISGGVPADYQINGSSNNITVDWNTSGTYVLSVYSYKAISCLSTTQSVTVTVNPNLPASVSIVANNNPVCAGTTVTYTATPTNGGASPVYAWYVNGVVQAGTDATFSYVPVNTDAVHATLTSNATCATGNPATSNTATMIINPITTISKIWHN